MAKIDDVARLAGVSTATVSRALRGLPTVSAATRARVREAAATLGYTASPSASRLAGGRSRTVAVIAPRLTRWWYAAVVQAAATMLHHSGHELLLRLTQYGDEPGARILGGSGMRQMVDAVLLVAVAPGPADVAAMAESGLPGVTVGVTMPNWPAVGIDEAAAAREATEHLLTLGHRRIAHLGSRTGAAPEARQGFLDALAAAGVPADPRLIVVDDDTPAGGLRATDRLLAGPLPTAVAAGCDEMAIGAMAALRRAGLRVPQDVSVVGIDGHELAAVMGLSTVVRPAAEQGRRAAAALLAPLRGSTLSGEDTVILPTHLVVRASTGPCPGTIAP